MMSKVLPVHIEFTLVVHMYQLVHKRALEMRLVTHSILAKSYATSSGNESSDAFMATGHADEVARRDVAADGFEMLHHEDYART